MLRIGCSVSVSLFALYNACSACSGPLFVLVCCHLLSVSFRLLLFVSGVCILCTAFISFCFVWSCFVIYYRLFCGRVAVCLCLCLSLSFPLSIPVSVFFSVSLSIACLFVCASISSFVFHLFYFSFLFLMRVCCFYWL